MNKQVLGELLMAAVVVAIFALITTSVSAEGSDPSSAPAMQEISQIVKAVFSP